MNESTKGLFALLIVFAIGVAIGRSLEHALIVVRQQDQRLLTLEHPELFDSDSESES